MVRNHGYPVEYQKSGDGVDYNTVVAEFPMKVPEHTPIAEEVSAIQQLEYVKQLQQEWSDNAVSCTIYFKPSELPDIQSYLKDNYNKSFKSLSFLLHSDHGFAQAPLESISEGEYDSRVRTSRPITYITNEVAFDSEDECSTGVCPIK